MQIQRHLKVKQMHLGQTDRSKVMQAGLGHVPPGRSPHGHSSPWTPPPTPLWLLKHERLTNAIASSDLNCNYKLISLPIILRSSSRSWRGGLSRGYIVVAGGRNGLGVHSCSWRRIVTGGTWKVKCVDDMQVSITWGILYCRLIMTHLSTHYSTLHYIRTI